MLTVDTAVLGRRERDVRRGFTLPPKIGPRHARSTARSTPAGRGRSCAPSRSASPTSSAATVGDGADAGVAGRLHQRAVRPGAVVGRRRLAALGLGRADRAQGHPDRRRRRLAADAGVEAIALSNHGGRQLDGAPATDRPRRAGRRRGRRPHRDHLRRRRPARQRHREGGRRSAPTACMAGRAYLYGARRRRRARRRPRARAARRRRAPHDGAGRRARRRRPRPGAGQPSRPPDAEFSRRLSAGRRPGRSAGRRWRRRSAPGRVR